MAVSSPVPRPVVYRDQMSSDATQTVQRLTSVSVCVCVYYSARKRANQPWCASHSKLLVFGPSNMASMIERRQSVSTVLWSLCNPAAPCVSLSPVRSSPPVCLYPFPHPVCKPVEIAALHDNRKHPHRRARCSAGALGRSGSSAGKCAP